MIRIIISTFLLSFMATAGPPEEDHQKSQRLSVTAFAQISHMTPHAYAEGFQWEDVFARVKAGDSGSRRLLEILPKEVAVNIIAHHQEKSVVRAMEEVDHVRQPERRLENWHEELFVHLNSFNLTPEDYIAHFPMYIMVHTPMIWHTIPNEIQVRLTGPRWPYSAFLSGLYNMRQISSPEAYAKEFPWKTIDSWQIRSHAHVRTLRRLPVSFAAQVIQAHIIQSAGNIGTHPITLDVEGSEKGRFIRGMIHMQTGTKEKLTSSKKTARWSEQKCVSLLSSFGLRLKDFLKHMDHSLVNQKPYIWDILPKSLHQEYIRHQLHDEIHRQNDEESIQVAYEKIVEKVRTEAKKILPREIMDVVLAEDLMRIQFSPEDGEMDRAGKYLRLAISVYQSSHTPLELFINIHKDDTEEIIAHKKYLAAINAKKRAVAIAAIKGGGLYTRSIINLSNTEEVIDRLQSGILCYQWAINNLPAQAQLIFKRKVQRYKHMLNFYQTTQKKKEKALESIKENPTTHIHDAPDFSFNKTLKRSLSVQPHRKTSSQNPKLTRSLSVGGDDEGDN